jgi:hypothetical protein
MSTPGPLGWTSGEVSAGHVSLDHDAAGRVLRFIDDYIDKLRDLMNAGHELIRVDAYGTGSARLLGEKFAKLASDPDPDSGSWVAACQQRIDLMKQMRQFFADNFHATEATDQQLADSFRATNVFPHEILKGL